MCQVCLMYMGLPTLRLDIDINKNEEKKMKQRRETTGIWNRFTNAITWGRNGENMKKFKDAIRSLSKDNFTIQERQL